MIEKLRAFLLTCPFLQSPNEGLNPKIYVDYLSETPTTYQIQIVPVSKVIRKYVDGGGIKQKTFIFRSIEVFEGKDIEQNMSNIKFFEQFSEWLEKTKPEVANWVKVEALTDGYFFGAEDSQDKATYQIQCRIIYNF